ncbi:hypothetical protein FACS1894218_2940 [Bacilli bacterium]|nr:hypothetical protein FACS1894218_2940 [Bacilli bacterium]
MDNGGFVGQRFSSVPSSPFQPTYLPDISPVLTVSRSAIISKAKCYYYNAKVVYDDGTDRYETYALVAMLSKENEEHSNN